MEPVLSKLSPQAQEFLFLLHSLDYLQPQIKTALYQKLLHLSEENTIIELDVLKRQVAMILFHQQENLPTSTQKFLKKDWPILFGP